MFTVLGAGSRCPQHINLEWLERQRANIGNNVRLEATVDVNANDFPSTVESRL